MICTNCGSDNWTLIDYDVCSDTFTYRCNDCCNVVQVKNNEYENGKVV